MDQTKYALITRGCYVHGEGFAEGAIVAVTENELRSLESYGCAREATAAEIAAHKKDGK